MIFVYMNRRCHATHNSPTLPAQYERLVEDTTQQSETLMIYYLPVFTAEIGMHAANLTSSLDPSGLHILRLNQSNVLSELSMINIMEYVGPNGLHSKLIWELATVQQALSLKTLQVPRE